MEPVLLEEKDVSKIEKKEESLFAIDEYGNVDWAKNKGDMIDKMKMELFYKNLPFILFGLFAVFVFLYTYYNVINKDNKNNSFKNEM